MKAIKDISKSKISIFISLAVLALLFALTANFIISNNNKSAVVAFGKDVKIFAKLSTRAIVQNYDLYYDSGLLKFNEVKDEILSQNESIEKFEIINAEGKVSYSSYDNVQTTNVLSDLSLDMIRSSEPTYINSQSGAIETIVYPYIEDWGAHKYSVKYTISPERLDKSLVLFRNEVILITTLLFILTSLPILTVYSIKEIELQRKGKERLEELNKQKDDFMTLVAHNLRTPISIMKGYTNLAEEQTLKGIEKEYIVAIKDGAERLNETTETILSVTSLLSGESISEEKVNLTKLTEETLNNFSKKIKEKGLKVSFDNKNLVEIKGSTKYLRKAIENYLDNAIKFNNEKGSLTVKIEKTAKRARFSVSDTGIGIKEEDIGEIFSSFHRSVENTLDYDYAGLGMGLYLTKTIMEAHKGTVWAESEYGKGSTFGFSLPIS